MTPPAIDWLHLSPIVIILGAAVLSVLVEAFVPARFRKGAQVFLALVATSAAGVVALWLSLDDSGGAVAAVGGHVLIDPMTLYLQIAVALVAFLSVFVIADKMLDGQDAFTPAPAAAPGSEPEEQARALGLTHTEAFPLTLFAAGGMMVFPAAGDLLTMFVALEVTSLPLYLLTGLASRRRLLSQEASLKYFLLGAFASAFFLFGAAWVYGATGTVSLTRISSFITSGDLSGDLLLFAGLILIVIGLGFKIGAVPFHMWTPDVYQGAPTPVTGFMAAATKIAAFGALLRIVYAVVAPLRWDLGPALWTLAIMTMVVGTVIGLTQHNIKRLLAYSAIAHAGFILTGVVSFTASGIGAALFYLMAYGVATVGAFAVVGLVHVAGPDGGTLGEAETIERWRGLGKTSPVLAGTMSLFLLAFAGIPLTSGFIGKYAVFAAAFEGDAWPLAMVGIACSAAAAFFYARIIVSMFFAEPAAEFAVAARTDGLAGISIAIAALATVALGVAPGPLLDFAEKAARLAP
ncbi:MAG: NADH-quinone oxidoreductase subunit NuoN [Bifidobacteriaceae bacterium]|jgi:NADH-quinone oxidoreductase subunit N|nr:NADH-quinone oxidoreductase subunit NuoN [Bifidobacteriaceae bacterium]